MNGIVIVNQEIGHNFYKILRLKEEFAKRQIELEVFTNNGTLAYIENGEQKFNLPKADFVFYFDKDIYLARELEKGGYRLFNNADFIKLCDDKMLTQIRISGLGYKTPKTFASPLVYSSLHKSNYDFLMKIKKELGFPMVVKKVYGSLGEGVYLVNSYAQLKSLYKKIYRNPLIFQEFVSSSFGRSVRVLVIDQKVVGGFVRYNNKDFRSNFGNSASGTQLLDNKQFFDVAQKLADDLNIEYAGIDFLFGDHEEPVLCEINSNAFFEEFEKITQIDVAKLIADMVIKKIK